MKEQIEALVKIINENYGFATESHTEDEQGNFVTNPNTYVLSYAHGGVVLEQNLSTAGSGVRIVSRHGYGSNRKMYDFLNAYILGLQEGELHRVIKLGVLQ